MQVATGTVINGVIVFEGFPLPEGETVTILARGQDASFTLSPAQEEELLAAVTEIERGEFLTLDELMDSLPHTSRS